jgi:hypothetical protein
MEKKLADYMEDELHWNLLGNFLVTEQVEGKNNVVLVLLKNVQ